MTIEHTICMPFSLSFNELHWTQIKKRGEAEVETYEVSCPQM
jgi:hypothetical protein